tara:strand:+ start:290 stop:520 length:231 start_codon:yes stop_codon:yes gene_type:complete
MIAKREGSKFLLRFDSEDEVYDVSQMTYITIGWRFANDLQTALSQLLLDFEIERGAYPISDEDDYMQDRHTTGEPF